MRHLVSGLDLLRNAIRNNALGGVKHSGADLQDPALGTAISEGRFSIARFAQLSGRMPEEGGERKVRLERRGQPFQAEAANQYKNYCRDQLSWIEGLQL